MKLSTDIPHPTLNMAISLGIALIWAAFMLAIGAPLAAIPVGGIGFVGAYFILVITTKRR